MLMENGNDINCLIAHFEIDGVGKSMKQCFANVFFDLWKLEWGVRYSLHNGVKLNEKFGTKPSALAFIPSNRIQDIEISLIP